MDVWNLLLNGFAIAATPVNLMGLHRLRHRYRHRVLPGWGPP